MSEGPNSHARLPSTFKVTVSQPPPPRPPHHHTTTPHVATATKAVRPAVASHGAEVVSRSDTLGSEVVVVVVMVVTVAAVVTVVTVVTVVAVVAVAAPCPPPPSSLCSLTFLQIEALT